MKNLKKLFAAILSIIMILSLVACGKETGGANDGEDSFDSQNGNNEIASEFYEFSLSILGDTYNLPADLSDFSSTEWMYSNNDNPESKDVNGGSYSTCDVTKDGKKITLTVVNVDGSTKKFSECKVGSIDCTFSDANDIKINLAKGVTLTKSLTVQDVITKWGDPTSNMEGERGTTLRYEKENYVYYSFSFDTDGKLNYADIRNWNITVSDEGSNDNNLDFLKNYQEPTALTSNIMDYIFRLENELYTLPAPVSAFTDDGWEITSKPDTLAAGNELMSGLRMKKGNIELAFTIKNFSNAAVSAEDTMITGIFINNELLDNLDFELSGGITFGISVSDLESKVNISDFAVDNSTTDTIEYSHIEPSNRVFLTFSSGKLTGVNLVKNKLDN